MSDLAGHVASGAKVRVQTAVPAPLEWTRPLQKRTGAKKQMLGIDVWIDFPWTELFPSPHAQKTQFRNCKRLAKLVIDDARERGNVASPALILTTRDDADEGAHETETHYVVVVRLHEYLATKRPDAALYYFATRLKRQITAEIRVADIVADKKLFGQLMSDPKALSQLKSWAQANSALFESVHVAINGGVSAPEAAVDPPPARLSLDLSMPEVREAVTTAVASADDESRRAVMRSVTATPAGRAVAVEDWTLRLAERIGDTERSAQEYEVLLQKPGVGETELQKFIESHPWIIGLDYAKVRPHPRASRGSPDFLLERYEGYHDILEIKSPSHDVIVAPMTAEGGRPPPNGYRLSPELANALAQVHVYKKFLWENRHMELREYGISVRTEPWCLIVIGLSSKLLEHQEEVLNELNRSLHRVEIVTFDKVAARSRNFLRNLRAYAEKAPNGI